MTQGSTAFGVRFQVCPHDMHANVIRSEGLQTIAVQCVGWSAHPQAQPTNYETHGNIFARGCVRRQVANQRFGHDVQCEHCGRFVPYTRCRVIGKCTSGRWQCGSCGCKVTQLRRAFGRWPTDDFRKLSEDVCDNIRLLCVVLCVSTLWAWVTLRFAAERMFAALDV